MQGKGKKALLLAAAYFALLGLLLLFERSDPASGIRSLWDAIWYSVVTLTTVGYGDLVPATAGGGAGGVVFLLGSLGILAVLAAAAFALFRERLLPRMRMLSLRGKPVYLFSEENGASRALAAQLSREKDRPWTVFAGSDGKEEERRGERTLRRPEPLEELLRMGGPGVRPKGVFLMAEDTERNLLQAADPALSGLPVCCRAPETEGLPGIRFFNAEECCGRSYWRGHPLSRKEKTILLIGSGALAQSLLEQAILVNCRAPFQNCEYHLFGDWNEYRRLHPALEAHLFAPGTSADAFLFHGASWAADPALLEGADRIIFCGDEAEANAAGAGRLIRFFPTGARLFAAGAWAPAPAVAFGGDAEVFTPEAVMGREQDRAARAMHEIYREKTGAGPTWEELTPFQRMSNRAAADHLRTKLAILLPEENAPEPTAENIRKALERLAGAAAGEREAFRRNEHERWARFHWLFNWRYGEKKNGERRTHPSLTDFDQLSETEQAKDDAAWENLRFFEEEEGKG